MSDEQTEVVTAEPPAPETTVAPEPPPLRPPITCAACGARIEGDQAWCTECGLAARTRIAATPNWRLPLILAGALGLGALVALVVAFVVLTGDNAPLPQTTPATTPPADTVPTTSIPVTTPTTAAPAPAATTPTVPTTTVAPTPTVPAGTPTTSAPPTTTPATPPTATTGGGATAPTATTPSD